MSAATCWTSARVGAVGAPGGGYRQRRHRHRDGDRREHGALGDQGRARRGDGRAGAGRRERAARANSIPSHEAPADWIGLLGDGTVRRLSLTVGDVTDSVPARGRSARPPITRNPPTRRTSFIDLYVAPVSVPAIGKRLLGDAGFATLQQSLEARPAGDPGRRQRRLFVQGLGLCARRHLRSHRGAAGRQQHPLPRPRPHAARRHPRGRRAGISGTSICSACPAAARSTSTQPWRLQLLAQRAFGARDKAFLTFDVEL